MPILHLKNTKVNKNMYLKTKKYSQTNNEGITLVLNVTTLVSPA